MLSLKKFILLLGVAGSIALMPVPRTVAADESTTAAHHSTNEMKPEAAEGQAGAEEGGHEVTMNSFWVLLIFIIMLVILYPTAWRGIVQGLKKREDRIRTDIEDAEKARAAAEAMLKESTANLAAAEAKTRELIAAATTQGQQLAAHIRQQAQNETQSIAQRTTQDIAAARDAALRDVHNQAALLSTAVAEKIVRQNLNDTDQEQLIRESLNQLQTVQSN
jgi:F-type H+-transporting ATPase subunit b